MTQQTPNDGGPQSFADVIAPHTPEIQRIAERLREVVRTALPGTREGIYGGEKMRMALYSLDNDQDVVCGIQPANDHCKLYIHRVNTDDTYDLRLEGKGKSTRHVKIRSAKEVDPASIHALLDLSVARRN